MPLLIDVCSILLGNQHAWQHHLPLIDSLTYRINWHNLGSIAPATLTTSVCTANASDLLLDVCAFAVHLTQVLQYMHIVTIGKCFASFNADMYGDHVKKGSKTEALLIVLKTKLDLEARVQRDLLELKGLVETIDAMSTRKRQTT